MRPILLLDSDGPLSNFTRSYLDAYMSETGDARSVDEVDRWAIHQCSWFVETAERLGTTASALRRRVDDYVTRAGFCAGIPVQAGAKDAVRLLSDVAEIVVVTSPFDSCPTWESERKTWLEEHFGIQHARVIHATEKWRVHGDVFLDDKPANVDAWGKAWPDGDAILFDMAHSKSEGEGLRRGGWGDVMAAVEARRGRVAA